MKKLTTLIFFCLISFVIMSQNTNDIPKVLYDAIINDESPEEVRKILETGINVNAQDGYNRSPLYLASYIHSLDIIKILLEFGADINLPDINNITPLNIACFGDGTSTTIKRFNAVNELVNNNADVNIKELDGSTALMRAVANGQFDIVKLLVENGADINVKSLYGETALGYAKRFDNYKTIDFLEQNIKEQVIITKIGNVREGPGTQFNIVGKVVDGQEFMKINESEDWYKIEIDTGTIGWISNILVKEVIDLSNTSNEIPEGFSPTSNIMNEFYSISSKTNSIIKNSDSSTSWLFELASNADVLEFSNSIDGLGQLTSSKFYYGPESGYDVLMPSDTDEIGNILRPKGNNLVQFSYQNGAKYVRWKDSTFGEYGPLPLKHLYKFIGKGSTLRFPPDSWIQFGDKQYRNGGFTVTSESIKFMQDTEVKTTNGIFKLNLYKWIRVE